MTSSKGNTTVAEYLLERLHQLGVDHLFGVPGDFVIPFLDVMMEHKEKVRYIGTANELNAAYAADGYARIKGFGALATTYVVGELSAMNGVAGAFAEKVPVITITGTPPRNAFEGGLLLHHTIGNYRSPFKMFKKVTAAQTLLLDPERAPQEIDRVLRVCVLRQLPVYIGIPSDVVSEPCSAPTTPLFPYSRGLRLTEEMLSSLMEKELQKNEEGLIEAVTEAAEMLNKAKKPIIIAGVELKRYRLSSSLRRLIEKSGIPYTTMMMGKCILEEEHPLFIGLFEGRSSREYVRNRVEQSDCVLLLGEWLTDLNTGGFTVDLSAKKLIKASFDRVHIRHHSYSGLYLKNFIEGLSEKLNLRDKAEMDLHPASQGCVHRRMAHYEAASSQNLQIGRLFDRLSSYLKPNAVVLADVGTALYSAAETLMPKGTTFIGQTFFGSIGYTMGATLGAAVAVGGKRQVVLFIGDGAFQMTCQDLSTVIRERLQVSVFLLNNRGYTIERLISDQGYYNDISNWKYKMLPIAFGGEEGKTCLSFGCQTEGDLENAVKEMESKEQKMGQEGSNNNLLAFVEVHLEKLDGASALKDAGKYMAAKR